MDAPRDTASSLSLMVGLGMSYVEIDPHIIAWAARHNLILSMYGEGVEVRSIHVSSNAGECLQIWVEYPVGRIVAVHADCVEGRRDTFGSQDWLVPIDDIEQALENVFQTISEWMAPSTRYFPDTQSRKSFES